MSAVDVAARGLAARAVRAQDRLASRDGAREVLTQTAASLQDVADTTPVQLQSEASALAPSAGVTIINSKGQASEGIGMGRFVHDPDLGASFVSDHPEAAFLTRTGRVYRLDLQQQLNVLQFGAVPTTCRLQSGGEPTNDCTAAFDAAQRFVKDVRAIKGYDGCSIHVPDGAYGLDGFLWGGRVSFHGSELGNAWLVYHSGAAGGAGSHVIGIEDQSDSSALPWAGFMNLRMSGHAGGVNDPIAENVIRNLGYNIDFGFKLFRLAIGECFGDAVDLYGPDAAHIINCHVDRVRFDAVGGHALVVGGSAGSSGHPITYTRGTYDNNLRGAFLTKALADGYYDGQHWGRGVVRFMDGRNQGLAIRDHRWEINRKLMPSEEGVCSLVYSNNRLAGTTASVKLDNVLGNGRADQAVAVIHDPTGRTSVDTEGTRVLKVPAIFLDSTNPARNIPATGTVGRNIAVATANEQRGQMANGLEYGGVMDLAPDRTAGHFHPYQRGSVVACSKGQPGYPAAWICMAPTQGFGAPAVSTYTNAAACTAGDTRITLPADLPWKFYPNQSITLAGAGTGGMDLETLVTGVENATGKLIVAMAPGTSVANLTIRDTQAQFMPLSFVPGASMNGNTSATLNLGASSPTQFFNAPLTADRTVTLGVAANFVGTSPRAWGRFRIVRSASATGSFRLSVTAGGSTLVTLAPGEWAEVDYAESLWRLSGKGTL